MSNKPQKTFRIPPGFRQRTVPVNKTGTKADSPQARRSLAAIHQEYLAKEYAMKSCEGPHSTPAEPHYEKSVKALPPPPDREDDE